MVYEYIKPISYIIKGFMIRATVSVKRTRSSFFMFNLKIWFILIRILVITHLNSDGVLHSNKYSIRKISMKMYFIFLLYVTLSR